MGADRTSHEGSGVDRPSERGGRPAEPGLDVSRLSAAALTPSLLLWLQRSAGNAATARLFPLQRVPDGGQAATIMARFDAEVTKGTEAATGESSGSEPAGRQPAGEGARLNPAELAKKKGELRGSLQQPDPVAEHKGTVDEAASAAKSETQKPPEPKGQGATGAAPPAPKTESKGAAAGAAADASVMAKSAFAAAQEQQPPAPPPAVIVPEPVQPLDAAGQPLPPYPEADALVTGLAQRSQVLRQAGHGLRTQAVALRTQAHQIRGTIHTAEASVAQAEQGVATVKGHVVTRREMAGQAKTALGVSEQKAQMVASEAPGLAAKGEEGKQQSGPMASEAKNLASESASKKPDDPEAAGKAQEQGQKLNKVSGDLSNIDSAITQSKTRAEGLQDEAAQARAKNAETKSTLTETDTTLGQTDEKLSQMSGQNAAAKTRLAGFADGPQQLLDGAAKLDERANALVDGSHDIETRLQASQQSFVAGMQAVPPVTTPRPPSVGRTVQRLAPNAPTPAAGSFNPFVASSEAGYGDRVDLNLAGQLGAWGGPAMTGEEAATAQERAAAQARERARHDTELAEIRAAHDGHFDQLSSTEKMDIALRLSGRNLFAGVKGTSWPKFAGGILRGFVDPRVSLMGIVQGVSMIMSGGANLANLEAWKNDPLGNLLKSAADIATGVTIVLGSIAGLAIAIIVIMALLSIFTLGATAGLAAIVVPFCTTVASTVGPWALTAAKVALVLHALVLIKNLVDAATASTAEELHRSSERITSDTKNMGNMAMQIGMAKAGEAVGLHRVIGGASEIAMSETGFPPGSVPTLPPEGAPPAEARATPTEAPATPTEAPRPTTEAPATATEAPATSTEGPRATTETPAAPQEGTAPQEGAGRPTEPAPTEEAPPGESGRPGVALEEGVAAERATSDGHKVKVLEDGRSVVCTTCGELAGKYQAELNARPELRARLTEIEGIADPHAKAAALAELVPKLNEVRAQGGTGSQGIEPGTEPRPNEPAAGTESPAKPPAVAEAEGRLDQSQRSAQQAAGRARQLLGDSEVRAKLAKEGALKGELEAELRGIDEESARARDDAQAAVDLGDVPSIDETRATLESLRARAEQLENRVRGIKEGTGAGTGPRINKADSPIWQRLQPFRGQTKMSGAGGNRQYYEWDFTHGDIEVYNAQGRHLGSMDPVSGEMIKPAVEGRTLGSLD